MLINKTKKQNLENEYNMQSRSEEDPKKIFLNLFLGNFNQNILKSKDEKEYNDENHQGHQSQIREHENNEILKLIKKERKDDISLNNKNGNFFVIILFRCKYWSNRFRLYKKKE